MPTQRQVLDALTPLELAALIREHDIIVGGRARAHLADRLEEKGPGARALLAGFSADRLKELCRALHLNDAGRDVDLLLSRLAPGPRRRPTGTAPLADTHPELAAEWHPDRNGALGPEGVLATSRLVVWWICSGPRPHVWQAAIAARATADSGCPSCALPHRKLLADHHPELARELHPTKNLPRVNAEIGVGTEAQLWWRCSAVRSHEWQSMVITRIKQPTCPICTGRILTPETSLARRFPEIAREWHPTRNGTLRPVEVKPTSTQRAWWRCARNPVHEWSCLVWSRTRSHTGCPVCFGHQLSPEVAFAATHPEVAKEWHPTKNGTLKPDQMRAGSDRKVWWRCARDPSHAWRAVISNRAGGNGCPMCSGRVATKETSLRARNPEVALRWHPTRNGELTPDQVMSNAKKKFWWRCAKDPTHEWQALATGMGRCPICVGKKVVFSSSLAGSAPSVVREWHPTKNRPRKPEELYRYSLIRVWWRCARDRSHEWEATIAARIKKGSGCPYCGGRAAGPNTSLAALLPAIAAEWHPTKNAPLTPDAVVPGAAEVVWWRCSLGHEWKTRVCARGVKGSGCRVCFLAKHRVWLAENNRARAKKKA